MKIAKGLVYTAIVVFVTIFFVVSGFFFIRPMHKAVAFKLSQEEAKKKNAARVADSLKKLIVDTLSIIEEEHCVAEQEHEQEKIIIAKELRKAKKALHEMAVKIDSMPDSLLTK